MQRGTVDATVHDGGRKLDVRVQRDSSDWTGVLVKHDNGNETPSDVGFSRVTETAIGSIALHSLCSLSRCFFTSSYTITVVLVHASRHVHVYICVHA